MDFRPSPSLSIGVEVELQLLDQDSFDLTPASPLILARTGLNNPKIKAEIIQGMLEVNTGICENAHEVGLDLEVTLNQVREICDDIGVRLASAGTHPFAKYNERKIFPAKRYRELIDRNQWIARRLMIFGLHVHVGMRSGSHAIAMNNALLNYLPTILAFSANSPFWQGEDTGLASSRVTFFEALPTGGHPCLVKTWAQFSDLHDRMVKSGAIRSFKDIWWDIRPSPDYGTLEIRICDGLSTLAEIESLTALIHSLCVWLDERLKAREKIGAPPYWIIRENKWRAARWGIDSKLIVDDFGGVQPFREHLALLLKELAVIKRREGYERQFDFLHECISSGVGYERQRRFSSSPNEIVKFIAAEFDAQRPLWEDLPNSETNKALGK